MPLKECLSTDAELNRIHRRMEVTGSCTRGLSVFVSQQIKMTQKLSIILVMSLSLGIVLMERTVGPHIIMVTLGIGTKLTFLSLTMGLLDLMILNNRFSRLSRA